MTRVGVLLVLAFALSACGGSTSATRSDAALESGSAGQSGMPGDAASKCTGLGACACMATPGCAPQTEACYCPSECNPSINCVCGGGKFLGCVPATG